MSRLKTLFYIGHETESDTIGKYLPYSCFEPSSDSSLSFSEKNGIKQGGKRGIRLYRSVESSSWNGQSISMMRDVVGLLTLCSSLLQILMSLSSTRSVSVLS